MWALGVNGMTKKLFLQAIGKFILGIILFGVVLFVPAGTIHYPNGWLLISVLFIPMSYHGILAAFFTQRFSGSICIPAG